MKNKGFTLLEIMFAMAILVGLLVGLLSVFVYCFDLQETSRNTTIALNEARAKLEEIRDSGFDGIQPTYYNSGNGQIFSLLPALNGILKVTLTGTDIGYVLGSNRNLIDVRIVSCWRQKGGRIIGNATFDASGNMTNCTGSPVELVTSISKRQ